MKKCTGEKNPLECEYCFKIYAYKSGKCNHLRKCLVKKAADEKAVVSVPSDLYASSHNQTIHNTNTSVYNGPVVNNTTNNINNIQNIIVFHPDDIKFLNDHISKKELRTMLRASEFDTLCTFSEKLLRRPENQCVRKTNLRSASSMVHVGANKWETYTDNHVLPKIIANIAINLSESVDRYKMAIQATLESYLEDITCGGEHGATNDREECKRVQACYRKTLQHVKHIFFNMTKDAVAAIKAQQSRSK